MLKFLFVTRLLILGILFSISLIFVLKLVLVTELFVSGMQCSIFVVYKICIEISSASLTGNIKYFVFVTAIFALKLFLSSNISVFPYQYIQSFFLFYIYQYHIAIYK